MRLLVLRMIARAWIGFEGGLGPRPFCRRLFIGGTGLMRTAGWKKGI